MKQLLLLLTIALASVACQNPPEKTVATKPVDKSVLAFKIDSLFNGIVGKEDPGMAVLIAYDGEMVIGKGFGLRDLDTKAPITATTNMRLASVSKQFTALTVLKLVDEGKLSLSDSVSTYLPIESFRDGTTVEMLINHTSGKADAESAFFTEWDSTQVATNDDILDWYASKDRTLTPPGESWVYNNGIYEFIPCLVEKVSEQDYASFAKTAVFEKAGMANTHFFDLSAPVAIPERAYCYERNQSGEWTKVDGHYLNGLLGAGGVYTSVQDYFYYDQALRNKTLFSEATHELIFTPSSSYTDDNGEESYYAMGWGVSETVAQHNGGWFGTTTYTRRYLDKPLTIAIFNNGAYLFDSDIIQQVNALAVGFAEHQSKGTE